MRKEMAGALTRVVEFKDAAHYYEKFVERMEQIVASDERSTL